MFTERGKTFTIFQCGWEFIPNDGCSNRESTLAQVQFSSTMQYIDVFVITVVVRPSFPMMTIISLMMIMTSCLVDPVGAWWLISPILACSTLPHLGHGYVGLAEVLVVE